MKRHERSTKRHTSQRRDRRIQRTAALLFHGEHTIRTQHQLQSNKKHQKKQMYLEKCFSRTWTPCARRPLSRRLRDSRSEHLLSAWHRKQHTRRQSEDMAENEQKTSNGQHLDQHPRPRNPKLVPSQVQLDQLMPGQRSGRASEPEHNSVLATAAERMRPVDEEAVGKESGFVARRRHELLQLPGRGAFVDRRRDVVQARQLDQTPDRRFKPSAFFERFWDHGSQLAAPWMCADDVQARETGKTLSRTEQRERDREPARARASNRETERDRARHGQTHPTRRGQDTRMVTGCRRTAGTCLPPSAPIELSLRSS